MATLYLTKRLQFAAAHRLRSAALTEAENKETYGRCARRHGHNYVLEVTVQGRPGADGTVIDVGRLEEAMRSAVVDLVDHRDLDEDIPALRGVPTTGEGLAAVFYRLLAVALPPPLLHRVAVVETENNRFEVGGDDEDPQGGES